jgi:hypothetical protein
MSSYIRVSTQGVIAHAKEIIVKQCHRDAVEADKIIDRLMKRTRRTFFALKPAYQSRSQCIEENLRPGSELERAFAPSPQLERCYQLLLAARKCQEDHMLLDVNDLSKLGIGAGPNGPEDFVRVYWDVPLKMSATEQE